MINKKRIQMYRTHSTRHLTLHRPVLCGEGSDFTLRWLSPHSSSTHPSDTCRSNGLYQSHHSNTLNPKPHLDKLEKIHPRPISQPLRHKRIMPPALRRPSYKATPLAGNAANAGCITGLASRARRCRLPRLTRHGMENVFLNLKQLF